MVYKRNCTQMQPHPIQFNTPTLKGPTKKLLARNPSTRNLPAIFLWNFPGKHPYRFSRKLLSSMIYIYIYIPRPAVEARRN